MGVNCTLNIKNLKPKLEGVLELLNGKKVKDLNEDDLNIIKLEIRLLLNLIDKER